MRGQNARNEKVEKNMEFLREENEKRKEVKHLHKLDQQETLQRKMAFERMQKENHV